MAHANKLIGSTSPYLLQHAHNPVNWYPWGNEALERAKAENKLILVSVGYSACHWCHVMERESFENEQVAAIMNAHFICIKVDREERPDIDQIYMDAVQLMTGRGGWPMNCICLPDQRPVYGGTYFPPNDWANLLLNLASFWKEKPDEAIEYADKLTKGIQSSELVKTPAETDYERTEIIKIVDSWKRLFDYNKGGHNRAPKFPMPNNWHFLMRYAHLMRDKASSVIVQLTLNEMAYGGIYDHIGGGFARYSVDDRWHVPHFEKMLYDNAQLLSLYSEAFTWSKNPEYKTVVDETFAWLQREMVSTEGGYYSALDADSEGVEGKFYVFTKLEIESILGDDAGLFCRYFNCTGEGNWEEEQTNVLYRIGNDQNIAEEFGLSTLNLQLKISGLKQKLFLAREKRIRPGLDDKIITAWNGLMLRGLCEAYRSFNEQRFKEAALLNARFLLDKMSMNDGAIRRIAGSDKSGFLDDYAFLADGLIALYEVTFDEQWLRKADELCTYAISHFYDEKSGIFFYTSNQDEKLIARKQDVMDNVIPSSNSQMARNLDALSVYFDRNDYKNIAEKQLQAIYPQIKSYPSVYSNWLILLLENGEGRFEIVLSGSYAEQLRNEFEQYYIPNKRILGGKNSNLPLSKDKLSAEPNVFVCVNKTCALPVKTVAEAIKQIHQPTSFII